MAEETVVEVTEDAGDDAEAVPKRNCQDCRKTVLVYLCDTNGLHAVAGVVLVTVGVILSTTTLKGDDNLSASREFLIGPILIVLGLLVLCRLYVVRAKEHTRIVAWQRILGCRRLRSRNQRSEMNSDQLNLYVGQDPEPDVVPYGDDPPTYESVTGETSTGSERYSDPLPLPRATSLPSTQLASPTTPNLAVSSTSSSLQTYPGPPPTFHEPPTRSPPILFMGPSVMEGISTPSLDIGHENDLHPPSYEEVIRLQQTEI